MRGRSPRHPKRGRRQQAALCWPIRAHHPPCDAFRGDHDHAGDEIHLGEWGYMQCSIPTSNHR